MVDRCQLLNFVHHEGLCLTTTDRLDQWIHQIWHLINCRLRQLHNGTRHRFPHQDVFPLNSPQQAPHSRHRLVAYKLCVEHASPVLQVLQQSMFAQCIRIRIIARYARCPHCSNIFRKCSALVKAWMTQELNANPCPQPARGRAWARLGALGRRWRRPSLHRRRGTWYIPPLSSPLDSRHEWKESLPLPLCILQWFHNYEHGFLATQAFPRSSTSLRAARQVEQSAFQSVRGISHRTNKYCWNCIWNKS